MAWYLFLLIATLLVGYALWSYRRKAAQRAAASRERFEKIFGELERAARAPAPPAAPARETSSAAAFSARERLLGETEAPLYRLLRAELPDHEIFAQVPLGAVVGVPEGLGGAERERRLQWLARHRLDFVVCDRSFRIVAAVELEAPGGAEEAGARRLRAECLEAAGVRLVRVDPAALPQREALRALVCGAPNP
ncbi:MAG TPA: DUF2726 domain-containing protein [Burkholderiales bacterium]|nr:DUF2726 domain-containing protein [Burkholderiales bacterium]